MQVEYVDSDMIFECMKNNLFYLHHDNWRFVSTLWNNESRIITQWNLAHHIYLFHQIWSSSCILWLVNQQFNYLLLRTILNVSFRFIACIKMYGWYDLSKNIYRSFRIKSRGWYYDTQIDLFFEYLPSFDSFQQTKTLSFQSMDINSFFIS